VGKSRAVFGDEKNINGVASQYIGEFLGYHVKPVDSGGSGL
jgi:hypothetical protein